jgi:hypothetical protein
MGIEAKAWTELGVVNQPSKGHLRAS